MCLERKARARRTTPPPESVVAGWYEKAGLLDSYMHRFEFIETVQHARAGDPDSRRSARVDQGVGRGARHHGDALWRQNLRRGRASWAGNERVDFFPVQWESNDEIVQVRMIDT